MGNDRRKIGVIYVSTSDLIANQEKLFCQEKIYRYPVQEKPFTYRIGSRNTIHVLRKYLDTSISGNLMQQVNP